MTIKAAIAKGPASLLPKGFRLCKVVRNSEVLQVHIGLVCDMHTDDTTCLYLSAL
jgi:hypothetical protein